MKSERELRELAEKYGVKTTQRRFFECRNDEGQIETKFMDLPRSRAAIVEDLRAVGALPSA